MQNEQLYQIIDVSKESDWYENKNQLIGMIVSKIKDSISEAREPKKYRHGWYTGAVRPIKIMLPIQIGDRFISLNNSKIYFCQVLLKKLKGKNS